MPISITPALTLDGTGWQTGTPFAGAVSENDIEQHDIPDCGLTSTMAGLAGMNPSRVTGTLVVQSGNQWIVSLKWQGSDFSVAMDPQRAAGFPQQVRSTQGSIWTALVERAVAAIRYYGQPQANTFSGIGEIGSDSAAEMMGMTGAVPDSRIFGSDPSTVGAGVRAAIAAEQVGTFMTTGGNTIGLVGFHVYTLEPTQPADVSKTNLRNPWGFTPGVPNSNGVIQVNSADLHQLRANGVFSIFNKAGQSPDPATAPVTPSNTVLNTYVGTTQIIAQGHPIANATNYTIKLDGTVKATSSDPTLAPYVTMTGLTPNHAYTVDYLAYNTAGTLTTTAHVTTINTGAAPQAPQTISVQNTRNGYAGIAWGLSVDATSYAVFLNGSQLCTTTNTSIVFSPNAGAADYVFSVKASNAFGTSAASPSSTVTLGATMPIQFTGLIALAPITVSGQDTKPDQAMPLAWATVLGAERLVTCNANGDGGLETQYINITTGAVTAIGDNDGNTQPLTGLTAISSHPLGFVCLDAYDGAINDFLLDIATADVLPVLTGTAFWAKPSNATSLGGILYDTNKAQIVEFAQCSPQQDVIRTYDTPALTINGGAVGGSTLGYGSSGVFGNAVQRGTGYVVADASQANGTLMVFDSSYTKQATGTVPGMTGRIAYGLAIRSDGLLSVGSDPTSAPLAGNVYSIWPTFDNQTIPNGGNGLGGTIGTVTIAGSTTLSNSQAALSFTGMNVTNNGVLTLSTGAGPTTGLITNAGTVNLSSQIMSGGTISGGLVLNNGTVTLGVLSNCAITNTGHTITGGTVDGGSVLNGSITAGVINSALTGVLWSGGTCTTTGSLTSSTMTGGSIFGSITETNSGTLTSGAAIVLSGQLIAPNSTVTLTKGAGAFTTSGSTLTTTGTGIISLGIGVNLGSSNLGGTFTLASLLSGGTVANGSQLTTTGTITGGTLIGTNVINTGTITSGVFVGCSTTNSLHTITGGTLSLGAVTGGSVTSGIMNASLQNVLWSGGTCTLLGGLVGSTMTGGNVTGRLICSNNGTITSTNAIDLTGGTVAAVNGLLRINKGASALTYDNTTKFITGRAGTIILMGSITIGPAIQPIVSTSSILP